MLMLIIILSLLMIGLLLIIVELVFIPGTTVVGILGFVFSAAGIIICYRHFGTETGFYVLLGMSVVTLVSLVYSFRSGSWSKFSLKSSIQSKVNEGMLTSLHVGDEGKTVSTLRPIGKVEFLGGQFEVKTSGNYVESGIRVRIKDILSNQIIVEPIN
jgi:membrane-bound ClpP family serine protease